MYIPINIPGIMPSLFILVFVPTNITMTQMPSTRPPDLPIQPRLKVLQVRHRSIHLLEDA